MKFALILALLLPWAAFGRDTSYQALRTIGSERSQALLQNVIEVKGRDGTPQPHVWTILLNDPMARGGVREIEVANGHITSERTPLKTYSGQGEGIALNFQKLNLDSKGAFVLAETEARRAKVGFFYADYNLRCEEAGGAPIWMVQLLDDQQHNVGSVRIAADSGLIVSTTFTRVVDTKSEWDAGGGLNGRIKRSGEAAGQSIKHAGNAVGQSMKHAGGAMQEFFTGERTIDQP
jgi:hypothetical protein